MDVGELLVAVGGLCAPVLLVVAAAVLAMESALLVGVLLPGASTVLLVGSLIGLGEINPVAAALILAAASTGGAQIAFALRRSRIRRGRHLGFRPPVAVTRLAAGVQRTYDRDAQLATMVSHLLGGARTFGPRIAATSVLSYRAFAAYNTVAAAVWVGALLAAGSAVGANPAMAPYLIAVGVVLIGSTWLFRRTRRRSAKELGGMRGGEPLH